MSRQTNCPAFLITSRQRTRLQAELLRLQTQYDVLTHRLEALDRDILLELDSERRFALKERRKECEAERREIANKIDNIVKSLEARPSVCLVVFACILCLLGTAAVVFLVDFAKCPTLVSDFDFESKTNEGWDIRDEGGSVLGEMVVPDNGHSCTLGRWSLRFSFELGNAPFEKAQIKYETPNLQLKSELTGRIYIPADAPTDLRVSCFALEDNRSGRWPGKPEWPWYQTDYYPLTPNQWTRVRCPLADFITPDPYPAGYIEEPLLVGFEVTRQLKLPYRGVVYLDKITLR